MFKTLLADQARDTELLERANAWSASVSPFELTPERLLQITNDHGADFATAVAYQLVISNPLHAEFIERIQAQWCAPDVSRTIGAYAFGLIPNLGYTLDGKSQIAGEKVLAAAAGFGFATFLFPTEPAGSLKVNARIICDALRQRCEEKIVIISFSKGSSDLKIAFDEFDARDVFSKVVAWINVCGLLNGTAIINLMLDQKNPRIDSQVIEWFRCGRGEHAFVQQVLDTMRECGRGPSRPLGGPLAVPPHIFVLNVAGFPLERHFLYLHSKIMNKLLMQFGPNDGFALLADIVDKPGIIFPLWGSDHYIDQVFDLGRLCTAVIGVISQELGLCPVSRPES